MCVPQSPARNDSKLNPAAAAATLGNQAHTVTTTAPQLIDKKYISLPVVTPVRNPATGSTEVSREDIKLKRVGRASYVGQTGPVGLYTVYGGAEQIGKGGYSTEVGALGEKYLIGPKGFRVALG